MYYMYTVCVCIYILYNICSDGICDDRYIIFCAVVSILSAKPYCANRPQQKLQLEAYYREQTNGPMDNRINDSSNCSHRIIYFKLLELHRGFYLLFRANCLRAIGMSSWTHTQSLYLFLTHTHKPSLTQSLTHSLLDMILCAMNHNNFVFNCLISLIGSVIVDEYNTYNTYNR